MAEINALCSRLYVDPSTSNEKKIYIYTLNKYIRSPINGKKIINHVHHNPMHRPLCLQVCCRSNTVWMISGIFYWKRILPIFHLWFKKRLLLVSATQLAYYFRTFEKQTFKSCSNNVILPLHDKESWLFFNLLLYCIDVVSNGSQNKN